MTEDQEVTDEAQRVAMTAAMAGTRVVETVAREVRERTDRARAQTERQTEQRQAAATLTNMKKPTGASHDQGRPARETARAEMVSTPAVQEAFRLADLSTGTDPAQAAAGPRSKTAPKTAPVVAPAKAPDISR